MYTEEIKPILNDDNHIMLITYGSKLYGRITHNSGTPNYYESGVYKYMTSQRINGWKEMPWVTACGKRLGEMGVGVIYIVEQNTL
jgi:hypothetical protein